MLKPLSKDTHLSLVRQLCLCSSILSHVSCVRTAELTSTKWEKIGYQDRKHWHALDFPSFTDEHVKIFWFRRTPLTPHQDTVPSKE